MPDHSPTSFPTPFNEVELTLVVRSERPAELVQQVSGLTSLAEHTLLHQADQQIFDTYFDTKGGDLVRSGLSLRVRRVPGEDWLTFKGPARNLSWGGVSRQEVEVLWSPEALATIQENLADAGIDLPTTARTATAADDPSAALNDLGLTPVQSRDNYRIVRDLVRSGAEDRVLAELVIDSVTYRLSNRRVQHREVEIESRVPRGREVLQAAGDWLVQRYDPHLFLWRFGKTTTGAAIEELLEQGRLSDAVDPEGNLLPNAYGIIEDYLRSRGS